MYLDKYSRSNSIENVKTQYFNKSTMVGTFTKQPCDGDYQNHPAIL